MKSSKTQLNILIVEDEEAIANGLMGFLKLNPRYNPHWVGNGKEGLDYILRHSPDIVILDIKLPRLTGIDVLKSMKSKMEKLPVVIMVSGQGDMESVIAAFRLGAYDYFQKPVSPKDLDQTIHRTEQYCNLIKALGEREKEVMFLKEQVGNASRHKFIGAS
ncbi:MAG TPA: response regulator, partial [Bacteroidales bacterium]|nr:response regulator [Bacteroidales bacterium]